MPKKMSSSKTVALILFWTSKKEKAGEERPKDMVLFWHTAGGGDWEVKNLLPNTYCASVSGVTKPFMTKPFKPLSCCRVQESKLISLIGTICLLGKLQTHFLSSMLHCLLPEVSCTQKPEYLHGTKNNNNNSTVISHARNNRRYGKQLNFCMILEWIRLPMLMLNSCIVVFRTSSQILQVVEFFEASFNYSIAAEAVLFVKPRSVATLVPSISLYNMGKVQSLFLSNLDVR